MDHGGERPYPCPECAFTCKTKQQLNEHRRKHSVRNSWENSETKPFLLSTDWQLWAQWSLFQTVKFEFNKCRLCVLGRCLVNLNQVEGKPNIYEFSLEVPTLTNYSFLPTTLKDTRFLDNLLRVFSWLMCIYTIILCGFYAVRKEKLRR